MAQSWECKTFYAGDIIAEEGENSIASFVIQEGAVYCYKKSFGDQPIHTLKIGDAFGYEDIVCETYLAASNVKCLYLLRNGSDMEFRDDDITNTKVNIIEHLNNAKIEDFEPIKVLGTGTYSTVQLAKLLPCKKSAGDKNLYAIKCFHNKRYEENKRKTSIENEIGILSKLDNPFIVQFFRTITSADKFYLIQEALLGGDLYELLQENSRFTEDVARFYSASVVQAFTAIHAQNIVYRDLKPENLILTDQGYIKIIDFGISKKLDGGEKTYTSCGTVSVQSIPCHVFIKA